MKNTPAGIMLIEKDSYELSEIRGIFGTRVGRQGLRNDGVHDEAELEGCGPECGEVGLDVKEMVGAGRGAGLA